MSIFIGPLRNKPGGGLVQTGMKLRLLLPLAVIASLLVVPAAQAKYRVGLSEQNAAMFGNGSWQSLKLKRVRYIVPWDWNKSAAERAAVAQYMAGARAARQDVLVTFTAHRGCFNGRRYSRRKACRAPSAKAYRKATRAFDKRYPWVRTYSAWNEVNHVSQPTFNKPGLAVRYYDVLRKDARRGKFKVMAADVLDTSNMRSYLRGFMRRAKGKPRLWGLHNYQDVNRRTSADTRLMLDIVPGEVWLTETGGLVRFAGVKKFAKFSEKRANSAVKWLFKLTNRYDSRRSGLRSKIARLYYYNWYGAPRGARFDAGLVNPNGKTRRQFKTFRKNAIRHR
jgi:Glycosyl hydrolase catalytic core